MSKFFICILFFFLTNPVRSQITQDSALNSFVLNWIGTPYKFGGSNNKGIDCSKLTQKIYADIFNLQIPSVSWEQWKESKRVIKDSLKTGDLVFFRSVTSPSKWHVGIYLVDGYFFHASGKHKGVTISSLFDSYYIDNFRGGGRFNVSKKNYE